MTMQNRKPNGFLFFAAVCDNRGISGFGKESAFLLLQLGDDLHTGGNAQAGRTGIQHVFGFRPAADAAGRLDAYIRTAVGVHQVHIAAAAANEVIAAVRKTLTENGIAAEDINTGYVELFTIYDYDYSSGSDAVSMYTANSMLAIQLKDMTQVGKVIDLAFGAGANSLNGVSFSASDTDAARKEALKAAVEQARVKAEVLAEAAGLKINGIEAINEGGTYSFDSGLNNFRSKGMADEAAVAETVVQAAKIQVNSTVNITFKAE